MPFEYPDVDEQGKSNKRKRQTDVVASAVNDNNVNDDDDNDDIEQTDTKKARGYISIASFSVWFSFIFFIRCTSESTSNCQKNRR